jgi:predicted ArsR family transcriptional regulator
MPRAKKTELEKSRDKIVSRYKRGPRSSRVVRGALPPDIEAARRVQAAYLRAGDYSFKYIAEAVGMSETVVRKWFDDPKMDELVAKIIVDQVDGAQALLKSYAIELIEMLVNIARETDDDEIRRKTINDALDRIGLAKVNKSQSVVHTENTDRSEVDITDKTGLVEKLRDAPPEVQAAAAEHMEALLSIAAEHTDSEVTHG